MTNKPGVVKHSYVLALRLRRELNTPTEEKERP